MLAAVDQHAGDHLAQLLDPMIPSCALFQLLSPRLACYCCPAEVDTSIKYLGAVRDVSEFQRTRTIEWYLMESC